MTTRENVYRLRDFSAHPRDVPRNQLERPACCFETKSVSKERPFPQVPNEFAVDHVTIPSATEPVICLEVPWTRRIYKFRRRRIHLIDAHRFS